MNYWESPIDRNRNLRKLLEDPMSASLRLAIQSNIEEPPQPLREALKSGATYFGIARAAFLILILAPGAAYLSSAQTSAWKDRSAPGYRSTETDYILLPVFEANRAVDANSSSRLRVDPRVDLPVEVTRQTPGQESAEVQKPPLPDDSAPRPSPPGPPTIQ